MDDSDELDDDDDVEYEVMDVGVVTLCCWYVEVSGDEGGEPYV